MAPRCTDKIWITLDSKDKTGCLLSVTSPGYETERSHVILMLLPVCSATNSRSLMGGSNLSSCDMQTDNMLGKFDPRSLFIYSVEWAVDIYVIFIETRILFIYYLEWAVIDLYVMFIVSFVILYMTRFSRYILPVHNWFLSGVWWCHDMGNISVLLTICEGNSLYTTPVCREYAC